MKLVRGIIIAGIMVSGILSCRNDPPAEKARIQKLRFEESNKTLYVRDVITVGIAVEPKEAKQNDTIEYKSSINGIIAIKNESGNDGVVFEGVSAGSTVITARANGVVDYCNITVAGGNAGITPYIMVPSMVMECRESERRSIVASLAGGTPLDDAGFVWSYTNQKVIQLETAGNVGVIDTLNIGESVITVSHPKAQFSVNVLVYVAGVDEYPVYITTDSNVINIKTTDRNYQYAVNLHGGDSGDNYGFVHTIVDGSDIIALSSNNNIGIINPQKRGVARIEVRHTKAAYQAEIVVIVSEEIEYNVIDVDKTLILMNENSYENVRLTMAANVPQDYVNNFTLAIDNEEAISVYKSDNLLSINGIKRGRAVITVQNKYADFDRQILVVVNGTGDVIDNEAYITTNQNVITMEAAGDDALLTMTLAGGNEADRNNFTWIVDDSTIISVDSAHGKVEYEDLRARAMTAASQKFEAQALIKAKKVGTARITLENPKSKNSFSVIVKVYKKGTFGVVPVMLDGPPVYHVGIGKTVTAQLRIAAGNIQDIQAVTWSTDSGGIAEVNGAGLTGLITGKQQGITVVRADGANTKHEYHAVVIVAHEQHLYDMPYMYVYNPFISVIRGESVSFKVMCDNMAKNEIAAIKVINNNQNLIDVMSYTNNIVVTGKEWGEAEIIVQADGVNTLSIKVMVEDYQINPDKPYFLRSEKTMYGVIAGGNMELPVELIGGKAADERNILWNVQNSSVIECTGNGKTGLIRAKAVGQTVIKISHPKSVNELEVVVYVAENAADLNKVVIYVKDKNIMLFTEEVKYIALTTNASDAQKGGIQWDVSNLDVVDVKISGDRVKAYIYGKNPGNAVVTVKHTGNLTAEVIYVSVVEEHGRLNIGYINVPSIVEMVKGDVYSIQAVTNNYNGNNILWEIEDNAVASIHGNGAACLVQGLAAGSSSIRVRCGDLGFDKKILLFVYNSTGEMANSYVMAGEQSRYVINERDTISIGLLFGMKGFPEYAIPNIHWSTGANNVVEVAGNGKNAVVKGIHAGTAVITAGSALSNSVDIEVEVRNAGKAGNYRFSIKESDRIKGIVTGGYADIDIKVFNGGNEVYNIGGIQYVVENADIISVTANNGSIRVQANAGKEGQSYIYIKHDLIEEARILVYTALNEAMLENMYPLLVDKNNYLLNKGSSVEIKVTTINNDPAKIGNIYYHLEKNNGVIALSEKNKREIIVSGQAVGSEVILVNYGAITVLRIYVSVTEGSYGYNGSYVITENIIGLVVGQEYETSIHTNSDDFAEWYFKSNQDKFKIVSGTGKKVVITAYQKAVTTLVVRVGRIERNILVFSCDTAQELRNYQAANIDQRYFRLQKNESVSFSVFSYQGKVEGNTAYADYYGHNDAYGNVIQLTETENGKCTIRGLNEGIAAVRITNSFYNMDIVIYVEVENSGSGGTAAVSSDSFITAGKTLYIIDMQDINTGIDVYVSGAYSGSSRDWKWQGYDDSVISVNYMGSSAVVNPLKEGATEIQVSNGQSRPLTVTVIVGKRFVFEDSLLPYIYVDKDVYEVSTAAGSIAIPYDVVNIAQFNANNIRYTVSGNSISVTHNGSERKLAVNVNNIGMAYLSITYSDSVNKIELRRNVYILVKDNVNGNNVYLTTGENYVIAEIGELRTIRIRLANYDETDPYKYKWSIQNGSNVIQMVGNGDTVQVYGINTGDAVITVKHEKAEPYDLKINVKIVKSKTQGEIIYLTTQQNVIETVTGNNEYMYVQKIGGSIGKSVCNWSVNDGSIVSVTGNSYTGQFTAQKKGVVKVTVWNEENVNFKLEIVIVVREALNNNLYISSSENLIMMPPGGMQKLVQVTLVNGEDKDKNLFRWSVENQSPSDPTTALAGGKVISLIGNNNECFINPLNEGTARIRVMHDKADGPLFLTVYITHFETIDFSVKYKDIIAGDNEFVGLNLPSYENIKNKVRVWAENLDNPLKAPPCEVYYTNQMVLLCGTETGNAVVKAVIEGKDYIAELYVKVVKEIPENTNNVIITKSVYNLNLKSEPVKISAAVSGLYMADSDSDHIEWEVSKSGIIDVFPSSQRGREIQITPKNLGELFIKVKHRDVDEKYHKYISVMVTELNNIFSVSKNEVVIQNRIAQEVSVNIVGGTSRDYNEVKWYAEMKKSWDGTFIEIVRVMGSGQNVTLYPINDGETYVYAMYNGQREQIRVNVVNDYYFDFRNQNERMYPGEERDLTFDVKPANTNVNWILANDGDVVTYGEVNGSGVGENGVATRLLHIKALKEGSASIIGMANGRIGRVNIVVAFDYYFRIINPSIWRLPYDSKKGYDGIGTFDYEVYPPDTYIKCLNAFDGVTVTITSPVRGEDGMGRGKITVFSNREIVDKLRFQQYKKYDFLIPNEVIVPENLREVNIKYVYNEPVAPTLIFIRQDGKYTNAKSVGSQIIYNDPITSRDGTITGEKIGDILRVGDGETHYILLDKPYENAYLELKSVTGGDNTIPIKLEKVQLDGTAGLGGMAIAVSGGPDYIAYNRVLVKKEIIVDVKSKYYKNAQSVSQEEPLCKRKFEINDEDDGLIIIYEYDKENFQNEDNDIIDFDSGIYSEKYNAKIPEYNRMLLYSTILYTKEIETMSVNTSEITTTFNVMRNRTTSEAAGVRLFIDNIEQTEDYDKTNLKYWKREKRPKIYFHYIHGTVKSTKQAYLGSYKKGCDYDTFPVNPAFIISGSNYGIISTYDSKVFGPNPKGPNIFGNWRLGNWSGIYYLSDECENSGVIYGETNVQNRLTIQDAKTLAGNNTDVIVPYYWLNRWPFRYEPPNVSISSDAQNNFGGYDATDKMNIVSLAGDLGGVPMPSVNRKVVNASSEPATYVITYEIIDRDKGEKKETSMSLTVKFDQRACSAFYDGAWYTDEHDKQANYVRETNVQEVMGPVATFDYDATGSTNTWFNEIVESGVQKNWERVKEIVKKDL